MTTSASEFTGTSPSVLWWSHSGRDYSRDRIIRSAFRSLGWQIEDFRPAVSRFGDLEARLRHVASPDLVWVPCFRQRDAAAAHRWSRKRGVPMIFDPLISAYDKQVFERSKLPPDSRSAGRLLAWESRLFRSSQRVIADTRCHADFFRDTHRVDPSDLTVIPVSAEEELFVPQPVRRVSDPVHVMFYGSFIGLQGPQFIAEAARRLHSVRWTFIGSGPLLADCMKIVSGCANVSFVPNVSYDRLPACIGSADILLGVFGTSGKADRVIPNKVYQSLACGRPVITQRGRAYPAALQQQSALESGVTWVSAGHPDQIAASVQALAAVPSAFGALSTAARRSYDAWFDNRIVRASLASAIAQAGVPPRRRRTAA